MDMVLVTIDENPYGESDYYSKIYAQDFYYYSEFGINSSHDGVIFLIDMANRYIYVATKGYAIVIYDDSRIDYITEVAYDYLTNGRYFDAYKAMITRADEYADAGVPNSNVNLCVDEKGEPYYCYKVPTVDNKEKLIDYANLFTEEEKENLNKSINNFIEENKMDMLLITIDENPYGTNHFATETYADTFYTKNEYGSIGLKSGVVIAVDKNNNYYYLKAYGSALLILDYDRINKIMNPINNEKSKEFYKSFNSIIKEIDDYAKEGPTEQHKYDCVNEDGSMYKCKKSPKSPRWKEALGVGVILSIVITFVHTRKYRGIRLATNADSYLKTSTIDTKTDQFLTTFTSRVRRSHDSSGSGGFGGGHSSGGGGHFGGSSTSHGSGGSFGGGGRHF